MSKWKFRLNMADYIYRLFPCINTCIPTILNIIITHSTFSSQQVQPLGEGKNNYYLYSFLFLLPLHWPNKIKLQAISFHFIYSSHLKYQQVYIISPVVTAHGINTILYFLPCSVILINL